jgi:outer membrane lipoprotein carrier protein
MKHTSKTLTGKIRIFSAVLLIFALSSVTSAITSEEIMEKVRSKYSAMKSLSASFKQNFYWKLADKKQGFDGKIYVAKDGMFKFEKKGKNPQLIVSDGKSIWSYSEENNQVIIRSVNKESGNLYDPRSFILGYSDKSKPNLLGEEKLGRENCYFLELSPENNEETDFKEAKIWVNRRNWLIMKIEYTDLNGNITTYFLSDIKVNPVLKESFFRFSPPEGIEVIDMR